MGKNSDLRQRKKNGTDTAESEMINPPKKHPRRGGGKKATLVTLPNVLFGSVVGGLLLIASQWYLTQQVEPPPEQIVEDPQRKKHIEKATAMPGFSAAQAPALSEAQTASKLASAEWTTLPRDLDACLEAQEELMTIPVNWPGFHALCIESVGADSVDVRLHAKSGPGGVLGVRDAGETPLVPALIARLKEVLDGGEFQRIDATISRSDYEFPPNPYALFTQMGGAVESDADLHALGRGARLYLYVGGQFIWPGVRIGHKTHVPIPVTDGSPGDHKIVEMTTMSLRYAARDSAAQFRRAILCAIL